MSNSTPTRRQLQFVHFISQEILFANTRPKAQKLILIFSYHSQYFHYSQYLGNVYSYLSLSIYMLLYKFEIFWQTWLIWWKNKVKRALHFLWLHVDVVICYFWFYWHWNCPFNCHTQIWFASVQFSTVRFNLDQFNSFQVPTYWKIKSQ